jgi:hypothetical protein
LCLLLLLLPLLLLLLLSHEGVVVQRVLAGQVVRCRC